MATTRQQSAKGARKPARKPATSRPTSAPGSRSRTASGTNGRSTASRTRARAASAPPSPAQSSDARSTVSKLAKPVLAGGAAVAAIVGGAVVGAKALPRKRRFPASLGNPLNGLDMKKARKQLQSVDMKKARKQVGQASKQFGALTRELRKAGEQAERIGDALQ